MASLEQMQGSPAQVLEEAAKFLGIDLDDVITRSTTDVVYQTGNRLQGFKEQWMLRWLLRKAGVSDSKSKTATDESQKSFVFCPKFWSLLLYLTSLISADVCTEILFERHFYQSLAGFVGRILDDRTGNSTLTDDSLHQVEHEGPPAKRRRLSLPSSIQQSFDSDTLLCMAVQASCACLDLFNNPKCQNIRSHDKVAAWTGSVQVLASLLGTLLRSLVTLLEQVFHTAYLEPATSMLNTLLCFWDQNALASSMKEDDRQQAFASRCLAPCISLLDLVSSTKYINTSLAPMRHALSRLLALHIIFPLRKTFNDQFTKKWKLIADVLLYEQMDTLLHAYDRLVHLQGDDAVAESRMRQLSWVFLDVAARSVPFTDIRRRQQEQHFLDSLFIWLVHVTWPQVPHITSTGLIKQDFIADEHNWGQALERLLEVARSRKLHLSLPVTNYVLQGMLASDAQSAPWSLLIKLIHVDPNILVPPSVSSSSTDFLGQITSRIESSTVYKMEYDLLRDQLVLPLMRTYGRSRALRLFVDVWHQWLAETIRVRYILRQNQEDIPALLVWDDDDIFDEFKSISIPHATPGMVELMLDELVQAVEALSGKLGSTASEFAKIAVSSALIEASSSEVGKLLFSTQRLASTFRGVENALRQNSDYQGQRWRLWRLIRLLVQSVPFEALPLGIDVLLDDECGFFTVEAASSLDPENARARASTFFLECLECFSLVIELAAKSTQFQLKLELEIHHLTMAAAAHSGYQLTLWNGRNVDCNSIEALLMGCIGKLLQCPMVFSKYPDLFKPFIDEYLKQATGAPSPKIAKTGSPTMSDLSMAILHDDKLTCSPHLRKKLEDYSRPRAHNIPTQEEDSVALSNHRRSLTSELLSDSRTTHGKVSDLLDGLLLREQHTKTWTNVTIASLAAKSEVFIRQLRVEEWSGLLEILCQKGQTTTHKTTCAVIAASVIAHIGQHHIAHDARLAQQLAEIVSLANGNACSSETALLLCLDNCKQILELHPLVVNQSTLDRLLASLHAIISSTSSSQENMLEPASTSAHIFEKLCAVIGAILGRHRRRISDRYHLLLPVLQSLLRCLFWPGQKAADGQRGAAASTVTTFGKTLPWWMRDSAEPLPLSSADHISRLLSSICNPTVSAARSSNRKRNELNDEVKKAREMAGQHMQYLVTEYCRCVLDGQIAPLMKDKLMPGMYRVIDAMDRDLMRAMNAGMDPSTRAIFKMLYDDWTKYGRWDRS